jgi:predicted lactoylglutathione lyase
MTKMIFVNLPVADLPKSKAFYEAIGFTNNPQFTNEQAAAMMWSDTIVVMLLSHDFWKTFTSKAIPNARESAQVALCINFDSRAEVDTITGAAGTNGGKADVSPTQDHGFMYQRSFEDPDGHNWEPMWMDPKVASGEIDVAHQEPA